VSATVTNDLAALATGFSRSLRASGLDVAPSASIDFAEAWRYSGPSDRSTSFGPATRAFVDARKTPSRTPKPSGPTSVTPRRSSRADD